MRPESSSPRVSWMGSQGTTRQDGKLCSLTGLIVGYFMSQNYCQCLEIMPVSCEDGLNAYMVGS